MRVQDKGPSKTYEMRISNLTSLCSQIESTAAPSLLAIAVTLAVIKDTRTSE